MFGRLTVMPVLMRQVPLHQAIQVVAVGAVGAEGFFIEQAFDTATEANLIGMFLEGDGPAHLAVPAATKNNQGGTRHSGSYQTQA